MFTHLKLADELAAVWFAVMNTVTFLVFGFDKWRAGRMGSRVPETTLVILGTLGGWLGGWMAMNVFRHKTLKWSFKFKYALALLPFAAEIWACIHWRSQG